MLLQRFRGPYKFLNFGLSPISNERIPVISVFHFTNLSDVDESMRKKIPCFVAIKLVNKSLLRVCGPESFIYLQSLLSNDMRKLLSKNELATKDETNQQTLIYSFLLSAVGKVLCDMFVYRGKFFADGEYVLEIDKNLAKAIKRLLLGYNVNKSIKVEISKDLNLWSVIPYSLLRNLTSDDTVEYLQPIDSDDIKLAPDPRIGSKYLGYRFLTRLGGSKLEDIGKYIKCQSNKERIRLIEGNVTDYIRLRYRLGLAEGYKDILSGFYFPFELNGDFLNAVSLNKGLYTSEEKMIKVYSSKPIKRRLLPVEFLCNNELLRRMSPAPNTFIYSYERKIGELRQRLGPYGIASLVIPMDNNNSVRFMPRTNQVYLHHNDTGLKLRASIPSWWPSNFDQIYLDAPIYPDCLFNLKPKYFEIKFTIENELSDGCQSNSN